MNHRSPYSAFKVLHFPEHLKILRDYGQPYPVHVQMILSDFCNQDCSFCGYRMSGYTSSELFAVAGPDGKRDYNPRRFIPVAKCLEILEDCQRMGVRAVQFTGGGEPTVHPQHCQVIAAALDRDLHVALVTNGLVWRDEINALLIRADWVRFSLDAGQAETYSAVRRIGKKAWNKVLANIAGLVRAKRGDPRSPLVIGIGFVVTRENYREVVKAARLARELGVDNLRISAVFQSEDDRYFEGWGEEATELCRQATCLSTDGFHVYNLFTARLADLTQHSPDYRFCGYQNFTTYIGADLNLYRCCNTAYNSRGLIGSLKDLRFQELWDSAEKQRTFADFDARGCARCQFNDRNRVILQAIGDVTHKEFV